MTYTSGTSRHLGASPDELPTGASIEPAGHLPTLLATFVRPKLIRLLDLIGKYAGLTMRMKEEEEDEVRIH